MKFLKSLLVAGAVALLPLHPVSAQQYPNKLVRIITPFSAGSGPDGVLRQVAEKMSRSLGQPVIIDNKPGGNGFIAFEAAKRSAPDGYTLVQMDDSHMALLPHLYKKVPYDVLKDFEPVGTLFRTYFFVAVPAESSWKSMQDLVGAAKAKPGALTYGSWFIGSPGHVGGAMLEAATGTQMMHVAFKETPQVYQSVANGDVAWAFGTAGSAGPLARAGKLRFLAVAAPQRVAGYQNVPTVAEAGGPPNFEVKAWVALHAPRGTPAPVVARLNEALTQVLAQADVRETLATFGFEPYASKPAEITAAIEADQKRYADIVKRANISRD
jgi:tripartite-type tricarboxylate transporter receptor subunit TctC